VGPPNKVQEKNLKVDRPRALGYTGINKGEIMLKIITEDMKFEKPKKKKIDWYGKKVTVPFDCQIYPEKEVKIANRFSGEETTMPGYAAAVYDTIIGAERFGDWDTVRAGLDWFRKNFAAQYMVVLD
jgi:hypothetical protein